MDKISLEKDSENARKMSNVFALLMIWLQSMMVEYLKVTSGIYIQKNKNWAEKMAIMTRQHF